jgi:hypothetical protein
LSVVEPYVMYWWFWIIVYMTINPLSHKLYIATILNIDSEHADNLMSDI